MSWMHLNACLAAALIRRPERVERQDLAYDFARISPDCDEHVVQALQSTISGMSAADIGYALRVYLEASPSLSHWHRDLLRQNGVKIDWRDSEPFVQSASIGAWNQICNQFDEDVVLAYDFASRGLASGDDVEADIANWRTMARCSDYDLETLLRRGVSDLHIHVGGAARIPQAAWLDLMQNVQIDAREFEKLQHAYARAATGADPRGALKRALRQSRLLRSALSHALFGHAPAFYPLQPGSARWWSWTPRALLFERRLLICAWREALAGETVIASWLDQYAHAKHDFISLARQPAFAAQPGLRTFNRHYFPRLKRRDQDRRLNAPAPYRASSRFQMAPTGDACAFLLESHCLRKAELRIAPFARAPDYWRFFTLWRRLKIGLDEWAKERGREPTDFRFAVHFKRTRPGRSAPLPTAHQLCELDRDSAALRAALACKMRGSLLSPLARIDVAGEERDMQANVFGAHLRLLRGDPEAITGLERLSAMQSELTRFYQNWERLAVRGDHRAGPRDRRLGLTVHAGEDFADPLEGLYQIASAIEACGLSAGDAIGHGLALVSPSANAAQAGRFTRAGLAHDALCWLYDELCRAEPGRANEHLELGQAVRDGALAIYGDECALFSLEDWRFVWRCSFNPLDAHAAAGNEKAHKLWRSMLSDPAIDARRERLVCIDDRARFAALTERARLRLLETVIRERIVVEMNPSSNVRISGAGAHQENPTVSIFNAVAQGLLACVNTDNPGVFVTCIENEYAALLEGARGERHEGEIRQLLERVREIGMERVYWRDETPALG